MAVSNQDIINFLTTNPGMSDADIASAMAQYGVSPSQLASATGLSEGEVTSRLAQVVPQNQATLFGDTYVQPIYTQIGSGMDAQQGPLENVITYKAADNQTGGTYQQYTPAGLFERTGTQQKVDNNLGEFLVGSALLFGGLGGGFDGLFGADAAAAAADADIAGGLIPEFGSNAAYDAFMASAMTPEALAALEAIVAANPEIIGSGALLTDAAAGLTSTALPTTATTGGLTSVVTPTTTTPVTTTTATSTVPSVVNTTPTTSVLPSSTLTNIAKAVAPSVVGGLLGSTVLSRATGGGGTSMPTPVSIPTQGMPLNTQDYFNAIQQNYNQIMPNVPRDVASPLAAWYNSQYGA